MVHWTRGLTALVLMALIALAATALAPAQAIACVCAPAQPELLSPRPGEVDVPTNVAVLVNTAAPAPRLTGPDGEVALAPAEVLGADTVAVRPLTALAAGTAYQVWFDAAQVSTFVTGDGPTAPPPAPRASARAGVFELEYPRNSCGPANLRGPAMTIDLGGVATNGIGRAAFVDVLTRDGAGAEFSRRRHLGTELFLLAVTCRYELPELQVGQTTCAEVQVFDLAGQSSPVVSACAEVKACPTIGSSDYVDFSYLGPPECLTGGCAATPPPSAGALLVVALGWWRRRRVIAARGRAGRR